MRKHLMPEPSPPLSRRLASIQNLEQFEAAARKVLPHALFTYVNGGSADLKTLTANRQDFGRYRLVPRTLVDTTSRAATTSVLGVAYDQPFGIAPMGSAALFSYRGDLNFARAARQRNIPMILSGSSLISLEDVIQANPNAWFQAYLKGDTGQIQEMLDRLREARYTTLVVTGDTPVQGNREDNVRAGFMTPIRPSARLAWQGLTRPGWSLGTFARTLLQHGMPTFVNAQVGPGSPVISAKAVRFFNERGSFSWKHLAYIRANWHGKLVLKGVMHPQDARDARDHGCDGIVVSNHGGRQLDGAASALQVLPAIRQAVPDIAVIADGGIRRAGDVLTALALGADLVLIGRPFLHAAIVGREPGVLRAIDLLSRELSLDMAMLGINDLHELSQDKHLFPN